MNTRPLISVGIVSPAACAVAHPEMGLPIGGSELQLFLLAKTLARQGDFDVTLYVADMGQERAVDEGVRGRHLPVQAFKASIEITRRTVVQDARAAGIGAVR